MIIFVSGIDTDAGKTYCTAWYAMQLKAKGLKVATMKFIQTGCKDASEDIEAHRRIMGTGPLPEDALGLTCPIILSYPASAQLAARIDRREIDLSIIDDAAKRLDSAYDVVLIEGAGGLMVPITDDFYAIDYAASRGLPIALVTNGRLGSINHTMLSLSAIAQRRIPLEAVLYNTYFDSDPIIAEDTQAFIRRHVASAFPGTPVLEVPVL